jgi:hypothetical protein
MVAGLGTYEVVDEKERRGAGRGIEKISEGEEVKVKVRHV